MSYNDDDVDVGFRMSDDDDIPLDPDEEKIPGSDLDLPEDDPEDKYV